MAPTYRRRLRTEGLALAGCGVAAAAILLIGPEESRRWPLNTIGQVALVAVLMAALGPRSVRRALDSAVELDPDATGSGEPTPLWQLPVIVGGLIAAAGLPAGWDAGLRVGAGTTVVGLIQALVLERVVRGEERRLGRTYYRVKGSRLLGGTNLGWVRSDRRS